MSKPLTLIEAAERDAVDEIAADMCRAALAAMVRHGPDPNADAVLCGGTVKAIACLMRISPNLGEQVRFCLNRGWAEKF